MVKGFVVGTLATINSMMTPFGGIQNPNLHTYPLQLPQMNHTLGQQCARNRSNILVMNIETSGEHHITLSIQGQLCEKNGALLPVQFSVIIPQDLLDLSYLHKLPDNASYVVAKLPSLKVSDTEPPLSAQSSGTRIKITKRPLSPDGLTPIYLEWLPNDAGQIEHAPMTVWLAPQSSEQTAQTSSQAPGGPPWARIEFPELIRQFSAPLSVSREVLPTYQR